MIRLLPAAWFFAGTAIASTIIEAPTSTLGSDFLIDEAATGSSDVNSGGSPQALNLDRDLGPFSPGAGGMDVTITGLAFGVAPAGNTDGNVVTAIITYLGADGGLGGGDDVELGSRSDTLDYSTGVGVYSWSFDTPISATIDGANSQFRIRLESDPSLNGGTSFNIRLKSFGGAAGAKLTVAGTTVPNTTGGTGGDGLMTAGYAIGSSQLTPNGETLFSDRAGVGGNDTLTFATGAVGFAMQYSGLWNAGASVQLTGIALPLRSPTESGTLTFDFYDPGADESFSGTGNETLIGSATGTIQSDLTGADAYYVNFLAPVSFTSLGTSVVVHVNSDASVRFKITTETGASAGAGAQAFRVNAASGGGFATDPVMKTSLAGTATGGTPNQIQTASAAGFWDALSWTSSGGGSVTGDLSETDTVEVGSYREITYRGIPATEVVKALHLGESTSSGQGILRITSGSLSTSSSLRAGLGAGANDSFVHVDGGSLSIGSDAIFGRFSESVDGSLVITAGTVTIGGDLLMGGFEQGGSMLRFHNLGSSPPVSVGGTLTLGRCSLDLSFDAAYTHVPGTVTTLVTYAARDGQFANFRDGDAFNCGKNRFRIDYDVSGSSITLTALENFPSSPSRPNIIVLFADDQGYSDLQLSGNAAEAAKFPMPRLQTIADAGARFTDAYMSSGVCHPSRCGLLTGQYQQRFGTDSNLSGPSYNGLAVAQRTIPRRLQSLGYHTFGIGKWHLGDTVEYHPNCRGFDRWYGIWAGGRSYWENSTEVGVFQDDMTPKFDDELAEKYVTDRIGDACVDFIDEHLASPRSADPFFIYVSFTAVHAPVDIDSPTPGSPSSPVDPRFARLDTEFGLTSADYLNSSPIIGGRTQATIDKNRYDLAAMTLALDENIGKVLDKLGAEGLTNDTLIVYTNDNGGAGYSQGFGGNYSYNKPLRGYKGGSMTDGSIRVPAAMQWPGTIPPGQAIADPVISLDLGATFVNAAGDAPAQARNGLDGIDLMPRLTAGTPLPADRVLTWRTSGLSGGGSAIRMGDWKMLIADNTQATTLYDIRNNPAENSNLAGAQPAILADLQQRFTAWESSTIAPFYGSSTTVLDPDLERHGISGGYRLKRAEPSLAWLSSIFRTPQPLSSGLHYRFLARSTESNVSNSAELAYALGDSDNRGDFIQAIIDYGASQLRLIDGKSGASASVALPASTTEFQEASLDFTASTKSLSFSYNGATVSLTLTGTYTALTHFGVGAAAMEGEITTLVPTNGSGITESATTTGKLDTDTFNVDLEFPGMPPLDPVAERSLGLSGFLSDPSVFVENLGGGLYRAAIPTTPGATSEFFRFQLNQP